MPDPLRSETAVPQPAASTAPGDDADDGSPLTCSAKGCQQRAVWALLWNNPKLHTPERRKTWLACAEHRTSLSEFLQARGFLRDVEPV